ncbi:ABC-2 family transporter protein [Candidatus Roizmanbacteria bacterium]|nr:ABC-2 family transporter protein [Candidatus Roizmanbacteria bacterium]
MKKYITIVTITIKEYFSYRLNFVLWRVRMILTLLITFFLWNSVFDTRAGFGHYDKTSLLSYILYANLISNFVFATRTAEVASDINDGSIINYLLKPISFFRYILTRDIAQNLLLLILFFLVGTLLSFYINLILSFIGFWTTEVWAPRFVFLVVVTFISGSYFPLDLLPTPLYSFLLLTPFPYLFYFPTKLMLGQFNSMPYLEIVIAFVWLFLINRFAYWLWQKGNRSFSFWGR